MQHHKIHEATPTFNQLANTNSAPKGATSGMFIQTKHQQHLWDETGLAQAPGLLGGQVRVDEQTGGA